MSMNEADTRYHLIAPVVREKWYVSRERIALETILTPASVESNGVKDRSRKGPGRTDYLLCVQVSDEEQFTLNYQILGKDKAARDLEAQAAAVDAVFDLEAVNPTAVVDVDTRTPQQTICNIKEQGRIVAEVLARLNAPMTVAN